MTGELVVRAPTAWRGGERVEGPVAARLAGGRVVWIGPPGARAARAGLARDAEQIELDGVLLPGVVDHHVHIGLVSAAAALRGGLTTVRDLAAPPYEIFALARASRAPGFDGPRVRAVGPMLTAPGGYPTRAAWAPGGTGLEIHDAAHARGVVAALARAGAVAIKLALNDVAGPVLDDDLAAAICAAAHAEGLTAVAHVEGEGQTARALHAGVDELAHTPWTETLGDELVETLAARMTIVSTIDIHGYGEPTAQRATALDNLRRFRAAGGRVLYGTDLANGPLPDGIDARELDALHDAGLTPAEILAAATEGPLEPGARADIVAVDGDPLAGVGWGGRVVAVIRAGRVVRR